MSSELAVVPQQSVPVGEWKWFGNAAHLIVGSDCRFHLATEIGDFVVSTVGEYFPDAEVREIMARSRNVTLVGMGDARRADYMRKIGYEEIGFGRKYETMVFRVVGHCDAEGCGCGLPRIDGSELDYEGANDAKTATENHNKLCHEWATKKWEGEPK